MAALGGAMSLSSCSQFSDAADASTIQGIDVVIDLNSDAGSRADHPLIFGDNIKVRLNNYGEGYEYAMTFSGSKCVVKGVIPGIYTINVSGTATDDEGNEYILAGNVTNYPVSSSNTSGNGQMNSSDAPTLVVPVEMIGSMKGNLVFSEIYFCGSKPPVGFSYFRDQFFEVANNTDKVQYLDGLYMGHGEQISADRVKPIWPESDGNKYLYLDRVWQFPGSGTDYPLQPGESAVVAQFAANHKLEIYNPNSPVDCSTAEFEFNMNNPNYPDQPAVDMVHIFYDGGAEMVMPQYLIPVFGTNYVLFKVPEGDVWDPVHDTSLQTKNAGDSWSDIFAKVPVEYVVDVVEGARNSTYIDAKNIPAFLDAGIFYVDGIYINKGVTRRLDTSVTTPAGAIFYQDTNNSSDDFEMIVDPVLHRHSRRPAWSHSLN